MAAALKKSDIPVIVARIDARQLAKRGKPIVQATIKRFGEQAIDLVGQSVVFNGKNPRVTQFLDKWSATRITGKVNKTTQKRIRTVLSRAVEEGHGYERMAKEIGHVFDVAEGSRAMMIARTEVHRASNFAGLEGYKQAGVEKKEWQTSISDTSRETHIEMNGQVVDIDENFTSPDGGSAPYPGEFGEAGEDVNCQCGVLPVVNERSLRPVVRRVMLKTADRQQMPYRRKLQSAMRAGFAAQRKAVMAAFEARADKEAA